MRLTLIQPSIGKIKGGKYVDSWQMQPLAIAVIAGLTPEDVEIKFYDDRLDEIPYDEQTNLVAIPIETYTAQRAYNISKEFRKRRVPVVMGGIHASLIPEEAAKHTDSVIIGDAEDTWGTVMEDARKGTLQKTYRSKATTGMLEHVKPKRDLFAKKKYIALEMVETGRGCPFYCEFCAIAGSFKGNYRNKEIKNIVADIESLKGDLIYFVDDNFVSRINRTKELCKAIAPLKKKWFSHGSINMTNHRELLRLMEKSGCANILIGFESLNPKNLEAMGKSWTVVKRNYSESISMLRDHGITIYATFVFGYDYDTLEDFDRTLDFAIEQKLALAAFNHLVPYPGTALYNRLMSEGRLITPNWWIKPDYKFGEVAFRPKNFSAEILAEKCFECRTKFYNSGSIFKRMIDFKANCKNINQSLIYFSANFTSYYGVRQRQYWPIGDVISKEELATTEALNELGCQD
ncbi:MAG: hypothetical protein A3I68_05955 [Candidatus Melainabacteria bacterium RIFCSPLOWO2_02_FULL_35_15]|nr:MAG: hypothetical protein A3F80_02215 [Candidatus Melainabacteria bacterium RIFCSPLOWO2_12_FULL_35_11]OGI13747.1 MAG: hypothetical protein A3I68_05955 [Candidatus Melainabacteria bacterium RIFCSPLOWO2_02_FULL_35_15]